MNPKNAATGAAALTAPATVIIGAGLVASTIVGLRADRDHWRAAAVRPTPTATVTATAAEQTPAPSPSRTAGGRAVVVAEPAARPASGGDGATSTGQRGGTSSSTAPRPPPGPSTLASAVQPARCDGAVSIRLPLGVLSKCGITIGGSR